MGFDVAVGEEVGVGVGVFVKFAWVGLGLAVEVGCADVFVC